MKEIDERRRGMQLRVATRSGEIARVKLGRSRHTTKSLCERIYSTVIGMDHVDTMPSGDLD